MQGYKEQQFFPHRETNPNPRFISRQFNYTERGTSVLLLLMMMTMMPMTKD